MGRRFCKKSMSVRYKGMLGYDELVDVIYVLLLTALIVLFVILVLPPAQDKLLKASRHR